MNALGLFQTIAMLMTLIGFLVTVIHVIEFFREMKKMLTEQCELLRKLASYLGSNSRQGGRNEKVALEF